jgi:hypothetical protein
MRLGLMRVRVMHARTRWRVVVMPCVRTLTRARRMHARMLLLCVPAHAPASLMRAAPALM